MITKIYREKVKIDIAGVPRTFEVTGNKDDETGIITLDALMMKHEGNQHYTGYTDLLSCKTVVAEIERQLIEAANKKVAL